MRPILLCALLCAAPACADDLRDDAAAPDAGAPSSGHFVHTDNDDGTLTTTADARDAEGWVYLRLEPFDYEEVTPADPASSDAWDLGFQRFNVKLNGGVSGTGGVEAVMLEQVTFDAMAQAPGDGYVTDAADGDGDGQPDLALGGWYDYDPSTHVLSPREAVYVVRTVGGDYVKLQFEDYYDDAGTSGYVTFRWGVIAPPAE